MKVAVIGSGISGLAAAHRLRRDARVTVFEAADYFGGHSNTVDVCLPDARGQAVTYGVDTGFLVFNRRTYPGLVDLFSQLGVPVSSSEMSFSIQVPGAGAHGEDSLEWSGASLATVFSQRRNLLRPRFLGMLGEVLRFNRLCTALVQKSDATALAQQLGEFLDQHRFGAPFRDWYLLPLLGCIWSCPTDQMLRFPVATMVFFCHNHGLLQLSDRPQWYSITGGARQYVGRLLDGLDARLSMPVERIVRDAAGVVVLAGGGAERFDAAILAVHSDQALRVLAQPSNDEREVLGAIRYQSNRAVLHTDASVMPRRRSAWAAWNYERSTDMVRDASWVCLHTWLNRLQRLPFAKPVLVSLNPVAPIHAGRVLAEFDYEHPVFNMEAIAAQARVPELQGVLHTWFCGAWTGYGFHEDGLQSGYRAADSLLAHWRAKEAA